MPVPQARRLAVILSREFAVEREIMFARDLAESGGLQRRAKGGT
jgi:hypothetical protein